MPATSPQVDAYIAAAPEFARPILEKIRKLFHKACPQLEETIKWGMPHFDYKGILGSMAAFKRYAALNFWKGALLSESLEKVGDTAMTRIKVADVSELPPDKLLLALIKEAKALNDEGVKVPARKADAKKETEVPDDLLVALKKNAMARKTFENFSPSHKREYVEWITEAKRDETRAKRIASAIETMAQGKAKNWKYMQR